MGVPSILSQSNLNGGTCGIATAQQSSLTESEIEVFNINQQMSSQFNATDQDESSLATELEPNANLILKKEEILLTLMAQNQQQVLSQETNPDVLKER